MPKVLVPLTDGVEEMEAVIIIDALRRAGWDVVAAGMKPGAILASRGVKIQPDLPWEQIDPSTFDAVMIPGGKGARSLAADTRILEAVRDFRTAGKWIGAICAAPLVLQAAGILNGVRATCHPSVAAELTSARHENQRVVVDGRIITSQGPGTAFEFALTLIRLAEGPAAADTVAGPMIL